MQQTLIDKSNLVSVTNYANKYGITRQTVYNWIADKKIKSEKIDGRVFIVINK